MRADWITLPLLWPRHLPLRRPPRKASGDERWRRSHEQLILHDSITSSARATNPSQHQRFEQCSARSALKTQHTTPRNLHLLWHVRHIARTAHLHELKCYIETLRRALSFAQLIVGMIWIPNECDCFARGATSLRSSNRFDAVSSSKRVTPVAFQPGLARLCRLAFQFIFESVRMNPRALSAGTPLQSFESRKLE